MSLEHRYNLTILEHHLDSFGHVNNAVYLEIYEQARWDLITPHGWGLKDIQKSQIGPVILEIGLKFQKELVLRDEVTIVSQHKRIEREMFMIMEQQILKEGEVASTIELKFGLFDMKTRKLIKPTESWLKAIGAD